MRDTLAGVPHRLVETVAGPVRYREVGDGPTLVFVHGALVAGDVWGPVVDLLADRHRCVVPDLPLGAHRWPARAAADLSLAGVARIVADLLAVLDLHDVTVVANDSGGAVTQALMGTGEPRLARVVLTPCEVEGVPAFVRAVLVAGWLPGGVAAAAQLLRSGPVRRALISPLALRPVPRAVDDGLHRPLRDVGVRRDLRRFLRAVRTSRLRAAARALPRFARPVLIVWAAGDRILPEPLAHRLAALLPDARVELLDDCRSFLMLDRPEALADLVAGFVAEPDEQATDELGGHELTSRP